MSVSRCITRALEIGKHPRQEWKDMIAGLPEACQHASICTGGIGCRERISDYLRVQYRAQVHLESIKRAGRR